MSDNKKCKVGGFMDCNEEYCKVHNTLMVECKNDAMRSALQRFLDVHQAEMDEAYYKRTYSNGGPVWQKITGGKPKRSDKVTIQSLCQCGPCHEARTALRGVK